MLAIGRGLMSKPKLIMLDEPSLGLAPVVVLQLFDVIRQVNQQGITVLLVEQNLRSALKVSSRAYVMENGAVVRQGQASELLDDEYTRKAFLGL